MLSLDRRSATIALLIPITAILALALSMPTWAQQGEGRTPIVEADVDRALESLRKDPNLATTRQMRTLKWIDGEEEEKPKPASWTKWLAELFKWFAEVSRVFVWLLIALLIGLLVLYLMRFGKTFGKGPQTPPSAAPTHVRDLDIRPESLPEAVGSEAWRLWQLGEHRNALSLLYRGLLSRMAHTHAVPIRHSTTEGDCLTLAERHMPSEHRDYVRSLVTMWQRAVYGGTDPSDAAMRLACEEFETALRAATPSAQAQA